MMRTFRNALYFALGLLLGCVSCFAFAADGTDAGPPGVQMLPPKWFVSCTGCGGFPNQRFDSAQEACSAYGSAYGGNANYIIFFFPPASYRCAPDHFTESLAANNGLIVGRDCAGMPGYTYSSNSQMCQSAANQCPIGATLAGGTCTCNAGLKFYDGMCKNPVCEGTQSTGDMFWDMGPDPNVSPKLLRCLSGCLASYTGDGGSATSLVNGVRHYYHRGSYTQTGNGSVDRCNGGPDGGSSSNPDTPSTTDGSSTKPSDTCPAGSTTVSIQGKMTCFSTTTGENTTTETLPSSSQTKTYDTQQNTNPDNSITVIKTVTNTTTGGTTTVSSTYSAACPDPAICSPISVTTSTTNGGADGETKWGMNGGTGSGTSGGDGNGDRDACEDDPERVGCKHLDELLGEPGDGPELGNTTETVSFNPVSGFGSGSYSCPANPTFASATLGKTITAFDYGPVCEFASGIRPVVIAFAALGAALIGIGAGRRE